ncbi:protein Hook homolog 2 [Latimeria chalumnae]|uniref:protein Hook homolog 2 n=1 Tax=Latimeria chalumnae TaxID=7897 RepID=UPI00313D8488
MSVDKTELCDSLLIWLQTFQVPSPCATKADLTSGVTIAHVLHRIDPSWFSAAWLGRIKEEACDNWRLKVSNLKKILQSVQEYYVDVLGHQISDYYLPDVILIGEHSHAGELGRLLQLVLGCAVSCEKKQEHIKQIMTLGESVQHVVMAAIQELMNKESGDNVNTEMYGDFDNQSRKYYFLSDDMEEKDDLSQRCHELELQVSTLMEEKNNLLIENKTLREQANHSDSFDESSSISVKKLLLLQSQIEQLQEENFRLESAKDDYRIRCEELERDFFDLRHRNDELTSLAEEAQSLKDEMDILRHSSDKVIKLEAMVETYKKKLEDLGDLRRQVKLLEERNTIYMEKTCDLEEELKKANAVRNQLEMHKKQVCELHSKHSLEAVKAEKWQFEYKTLLEKYEALLKEKQRLIVERDTLRETNEELRCAQVQQKSLKQADAVNERPSSPADNLAAEIMPAELKSRETIIRLQRENKVLCHQELSSQQRLMELQGQLEQSNRSKNRLETENRLHLQQITELKAQVEELQRSLQEQGSKAEDAISSLLKRKLEEHFEKLHEAHSELQKKREYIDGLEPKVDSNTARKIDELQEILRKKDEDMRVMEERYKRYVEKARTVIKTLDPKQQTMKVGPEIQALKNQLHEKDVKIQHMEHDFEKTKTQREQEEKLIISAWYNMGMALHQQVTEERTQHPGHPQSFLGQQRLATNARRGHSGRLQQPLPR